MINVHDIVTLSGSRRTENVPAKSTGSVVNVQVIGGEEIFEVEFIVSGQSFVETLIDTDIEKVYDEIVTKFPNTLRNLD